MPLLQFVNIPALIAIVERGIAHNARFFSLDISYMVAKGCYLNSRLTVFMVSKGCVQHELGKQSLKYWDCFLPLAMTLELIIHKGSFLGGAHDITQFAVDVRKVFDNKANNTHKPALSGHSLLC